MADVLGDEPDSNLDAVRAAAPGSLQAQAAAQHLFLAAVPEDMVGKRARIAVDAAAARGEVDQSAGGFHVAALAVLAGPPRGALAPFRIRGVNVDAKDDAFVASGTVSAVAVEGGGGVLAAVYVIKRAEEQLSLRRS